MKLQNFIGIAGLLSTLVMVTFPCDSSAKPHNEEDRFLFPLPTDGSALGILAGLGLAAGAGLLLGSALGGIGRGNRYGRRRRYGGHSRYGGHRGWGKRENENNVNDPFDAMEEKLLSDMFELMINTDPDDCYRRLICDIASREPSFVSFHPFLSFASDDEDLFVPVNYLEYSDKLKSARKVGDDSQNPEVCEDTFQCPFSGSEMSEVMKEKFKGKTEQNY